MRERYLDTAGPFREVVVSLISTFAKLEKDRLEERLAAARAKLKKDGREWGRPRRGYSESDRARGVKPLDVERARRMKAAGKSPRQIAVALKVPRTTIRRALVRAE